MDGDTVRHRTTAALALIAGTAFGILLAGQPARADSPDTVTVEWLMSNTTMPTNTSAQWPQSLLTDADCGYVQRDVYDISTPERAAQVSAITADGTLTQGEDEPVIVSWEFVHIPCGDTRADGVAVVLDAKQDGQLAETGGTFPHWLWLIPTGLLIIGGAFMMTKKRKKPRSAA